MGNIGKAVRHVMGQRVGDRLGFWVDLRDILFVAATRP